VRLLRFPILFAVLVCLPFVLSSCSKAPAPHAYPVQVPDEHNTSPDKGAGVPDEATKHDHHERTPGRSPASVDTQPTEDQLIEQSLKNLKQGRLAYETPSKMKTGESQTVTARIGSDQVDGGALTQGLGQSGETVGTATTPVSVKMKMMLKSVDFDITPLSSEEQVVAGTTPTVWQWTVTPKKSGMLRLHLDAVVELKNVSRDYPTVDREIAVSVDPVDALTGFVQHNWQWMLSTLAAGIGLAWKFFGSKKKDPSGPATT
jgi:hypothetical protein